MDSDPGIMRPWRNFALVPPLLRGAVLPTRIALLLRARSALSGRYVRERRNRILPAQRVLGGIERRANVMPRAQTLPRPTMQLPANFRNGIKDFLEFASTLPQKNQRLCVSSKQELSQHMIVA